MEESAIKEEPSERRSERKKRKRMSFSPDISKADGLKKKASIHSMKTSPGRSYDIVNGQPFCCHMCKSPYVVNLKSKLVKKSLPSRHTPLPKSRIDMLTQQPIQLCNSCVSLYDRSQKRLAKAVTLPTKEEQKLYMEDISEYIQMLKAEWDEPLVERLYCPPNQRKLCGCLQKHRQSCIEGR
ncbi:hypothetical protein DPMN_150422 [Dreissena polymorpha]|uniref:Uncharacterized protein n=1 Tax=Dreissena polymorpha TaxID=45954 RepID=A0A9D4FJB2_DREPO|nr:hypothetical protein DPMN_150422 [Dreissena polymorpha]